MKPSTIAQISLGTAVAGALGYALYFDHKRRHDPEFRRKLKRESKRTKLESDRQVKNAQRQKRAQMQEVVDEMRRPGVVPDDSAGRQQFFMENLSAGEAYSALGATHYLSAAISLFRAVKVYPNPMELMSTVEQAVPQPVMEYLVEIMGLDLAAERSNSGAGSRGGQEAPTDPNAFLAQLLQQAGAQVNPSSLTSSGADDVDDDSPASAPNSQNSQDWVDVSDNGSVNEQHTAASSSNLAETVSSQPSASTAAATPSASGVTEETQDIGVTPEQVDATVPAEATQETNATTTAAAAAATTSAPAFDFASSGASSFQPTDVFSPSSEQANKPPQ